MTLAGSVALITGGARMGAALGRSLAERGADVAFTWRSSAGAIADAVEGVRQTGTRATAFQADLSSPAACQRLVSEVVAWGGRVDVLVCLASLYERVPLGALTRQHWRRQLSVDLDATFHCARAAAAHMQAQRSGRMVFCGDWVAASGRPRYTGYVPYYVAKHGVLALTRAFAEELSPYGIQVNAIAPGPILPPVEITDESDAAVVQATPLGRWGGPEALTDAVVALLEQDGLSGQIVRVDGGRHLL